MPTGFLKILFFREWKKGEQDSICPVCESQLDGKICLHHIDYKHICQFGESIEILTGRVAKSGHQRINKSPNCEKCFKNKREFFNSCENRLVLVHNSCHGKLHNKNKKRD